MSLLIWFGTGTNFLCIFVNIKKLMQCQVYFRDEPIDYGVLLVSLKKTSLQLGLKDVDSKSLYTILISCASIKESILISLIVFVLYFFHISHSCHISSKRNWIRIFKFIIVLSNISTTFQVFKPLILFF